MKILYGVQGTGNGHITRARHMAASFAKQPDIEIDYLFSGRATNTYFDMDAFTGHKAKRGLTFVSENGQIKRLKTVFKNNLFHFYKEVSELNLSKYDLVINDFEPVSAWAAKKSGIPSISVSHQAAFLHRVPKKEQRVADKLITKHFAPTQFSLGTHWYHFGHNIIPPVVANDLQLKARATKTLSSSDKILVYLPFESLGDIRTQLQILSDWQFVCYHPNINETRIDHNIIWKPLSNTTFKQDLLVSNGVISNSGFELSTECLSIGKPLLVTPLKKQYEQVSNAYTLQTLGLCEVMNELNAEDIDDWLQTKKGVSVTFPSNCDDLVDWIIKGNWQQTDKICQSLWQQVDFPQHVKGKLNDLMHINN